MLGLSLIGILIFYPTMVLLWPNVQYQNKSLDLKYNPTYLVVQGNIKFLVAGSAAFFGHKDVVICMLGFNSVLLLGKYFNCCPAVSLNLDSELGLCLPWQWHRSRRASSLS